MSDIAAAGVDFGVLTATRRVITAKCAPLHEFPTRSRFDSLLRFCNRCCLSFVTWAMGVAKHRKRFSWPTTWRSRTDNKPWVWLSNSRQSGNIELSTRGQRRLQGNSAKMLQSWEPARITLRQDVARGHAPSAFCIPCTGLPCGRARRSNGAPAPDFNRPRRRGSAGIYSPELDWGAIATAGYLGLRHEHRHYLSGLFPHKNN